MAFRFSNTEKWQDTWFSDLKPLSKLLFMYLCDQCDIAGIYQLNVKTMAFEIGTDKQTIEKALKEVESRVLYSKDEKFLFIKNFLKHQRNYPFNEKNGAHTAIIKILEANKELFGFQYIEQFFNRGVDPPLTPPLGGYGNSIGNSMGIGNERDSNKGGMGEKEKEKTWRDSFDVYLEEETTVYNNLIHNQDFIKDRQKYFPNVDIVLSLEKAHRDFWGTEAGWKNKKSSRTNKIDWISTFKKALDQSFNKVYIQNNGQSTYQTSAGRTYTSRQNAADKERSRDNLENLADAILGQHTS